VRVSEKYGTLRENIGRPGSFHINITTNDRTNIKGIVYHWNNFLMGRPDKPYNVKTIRYRHTANMRLLSSDTKSMISNSINAFVQGLILENNEVPFSL
jgi:hypothetical protein